MFLDDYISRQQPGPLDTDELVAVLYPAWEHLAGSDACAMAPHKLDRMESPRWEPPLIIFELERHGATVAGSIGAEVQRWEVDVEAGTAWAETVGSRRVGQAQAPLDVKAIARDLAHLIRSGADDPRIERKADGRVKILVAGILPTAAKQTTDARRRRLYQALDGQMADYTRAGAMYRPL